MNLVPSQEENKCPGAEENGVSILHGNALAFVKVSPSLCGYTIHLEIQRVKDVIRNSAQLTVDNFMKVCQQIPSAVVIPIGFADNNEPIRKRLIRVKRHWYAERGREGG